MGSTYIDHSLREVALRSFRESLSNARERLRVNQDELEAIELKRKEIEQERDSSKKDCDDLSRLIDVLETEIMASQIQEVFGPLNRSNSDESSLEEDDEEEETDEPGIDNLKRKRKRLNARPRTLELIQRRKKFVTVDEVINLVKAVYEEGEIQDKTIKNAVWDLTASDALKKLYSKSLKEYIYGIHDWLDANGNPKPEYAETESSNDTNIDSGVFFKDEEDDDLPF